jgi:hypothetical protein
MSDKKGLFMPIKSDDTKIRNVLKSFEKNRRSSQSKFSDTLSKIIKRCDSAEIEHNPASISSQDKKLVVQISSGREKIDLIIREHQQAELLLCVPFEEIRGISGYRAFCSYENNYIEAMLETGRRFGVPSSFLFQRVQRAFSKTSEKESDGESNNRIEFTVDDSYPDLKVSIGLASYNFSILEALRVNRPFLQPGRIHRPLTIQIEGMAISKHDQALALLEKITNACLFQFDLLVGFPMYLAMDFDEFRRSQPRRLTDSSPENLSLSLPKFQYDTKPMSLYWYAGTAEGIPLLQFLAYYQVIEFYFPMFAEKATHDIAKRILKDPTFDRSRDIHINQLISSLKPYLTKGGYGEERTALLATIRESITEQELRSFFQDDKERLDFYKTKASTISSEKISVDRDKADIVTETANRIYDIRCKIVHTKASENTNSDLLLPFSKEAQQLGFDIELVQFLARKVLIVSGNTLAL